METGTPFKKSDRQHTANVQERSSSNSNSHDIRFQATNSNPSSEDSNSVHHAPSAEHPGDSSINGTADGSGIMPADNNLLALPTAPADDQTFTPAYHQALMDPLEVDGYNIILDGAHNHISEESAFHLAREGSPPIQETVADEHDERNLIIPMPL